MTSTPKRERRSTKPARGAPRADALPASTPAGVLVGADRQALSDDAGWDPERGAWVHGDPGKHALELVNEAAAKRRR